MNFAILMSVASFPLRFLFNFLLFVYNLQCVLINQLCLSSSCRIENILRFRIAFPLFFGLFLSLRSYFRFSLFFFILVLLIFPILTSTHLSDDLTLFFFGICFTEKQRLYNYSLDRFINFRVVVFYILIVICFIFFFCVYKKKN